MTKYRLVDDTDLSFNPRQPRDSHGRWTSGAGTVALREAGGPVAYMVNGKGYSATGKVALKRASGNPAADFLHQTTPSIEGKVSLRPKAPATVLSGASILDVPNYHEAKPAPKPDSVGESIWSRLAQPGVDTNAIARQIIEETGLSNDGDKENLSSDMGLNPKLAGKSIRELRRTVRAKGTSPEKRADAKKELVQRVAMKKAVEDEKGGFTNKLSRAFEDAPEGADLAPIIGETLAAHPRLGPLAHLWDRIRLAGYNTKKHVTSKEFGDELPRIIARSAVNVLIALLAIHFGVGIPGISPGGGDG